MGNPLLKYSREYVRGRLLSRRGLSVKRWAEETGFNLSLVMQVLRLYCGQDRTPYGVKTKAILTLLGRICEEDA